MSTSDVDPPIGSVWRYDGPTLGAGFDLIGPDNLAPIENNTIIGNNTGILARPDALSPLAVREVINNGKQNYRTPYDFGAVCDVAYYASGATWTAGVATFTPGNGIVTSAADIGKRLVIYGAGLNGTNHVATITGANGTLWNLSAAPAQATGLRVLYGGIIPALAAGATGYAPGDTITWTGGTITGGSNASSTVKYTGLNAAFTPTIVAGGSGGTDGSVTLTGTTGRGTYFLLAGTISGGALTAITSISRIGAYFTNPTNPADEPVVAHTADNGVLTNPITGARVALRMVPVQYNMLSPGGYVGVFAGPLTQGSTSGGGTGAEMTPTFSNNNATGRYGSFYYGTDDAVALQAAAAWAQANNGTIRWPPNIKCGTTTQINITGNFACFEGSSVGNRRPTNLGATGSTNQEGIFWLGAADDNAAIIQIRTPDGSNSIVGNSVRRLALVCGHLAGYGIRVKTQQGGKFDENYIEQARMAALELNINPAALEPQTAQFIGMDWNYGNQVNTNGAIFSFTSDLSSPENSDPCQVRGRGNEGFEGWDTPFRFTHTDHLYFDGLRAGSAVYSGALYSIDFWADTSGRAISNGHRITNFVGGKPMVFRGTTSSGAANTYTQNIVVDDTTTAIGFELPIYEPPGSAIMGHTFLRDGRPVTGVAVPGVTSGQIVLTAPSTAGNHEIRFPSGTTIFTTTGPGFLYQASGAAPITVTNDPIISTAKRSTSNLSKTADTALALVPNLSIPLIAGAKYIVRGYLNGTAGAAGGIHVQLIATNGLTITTARFNGRLFNGTTFLSNLTVTALAADLAATTGAFTDLYIEGSIDVLAGGNLEVHAAQNVSDAAVTLIRANSNFSCVRVA